jgi:hypothetical protein
VLTKFAHVKAAPGKFEVKRLGALEHSNDGMVVSSSGYSASNFTGSARKVVTFINLLYLLF